MAGPAFADKPPWAGKKDKDKAQYERKKGSSKAKGRDVDPHSGKSPPDVRAKEYFGDRHRVVIRDHYVSEFRSGRCPKSRTVPRPDGSAAAGVKRAARRARASSCARGPPQAPHRRDTRR